MIYQVKLRVDVQEIRLERVYPTKDFLENDKIASVFKKTVEENYDVPITVVKSSNDFLSLTGITAHLSGRNSYSKPFRLTF